MDKNCHSTKIFRATITPSLLVSANYPIFTIKDVTDSFLAEIGMERESFIGHSVFDFFSSKLAGFPDRLSTYLQDSIEKRVKCKIECVDFKTKEEISDLFFYFFSDIVCLPILDEVIDSEGHTEDKVTDLILSLTEITSQKTVNDLEPSIDINDNDTKFKGGIWNYDMASRIYTASDEVYEIYGLNPKTVTTIDYIQQFTHPNDLEKRNRIIDYAMSIGKEYFLTYRIITSDKKIKNLVSVGYPIKDSRGNLMGYEGFLKLVVCKKQIERKLFEIVFDLHKKNLLIEKMISNIPIGIAINKISTGETSLINNEFENLYGWDNKEIHDLNTFLDCIYTTEKLRNDVANAISNNNLYQNDELLNWRKEVIITENGKQKILNTKQIPLVELDVLITTVVDITEGEQHLKELKIANDRYNYVAMATDDAVFDWDIINDTIFWKNNILTEELGYKEGFERNNLTQWLNGIHPEDVDAFTQNLNSILNDKETVNWNPEHYRILKADNSYAYIKGMAFLIRNNEGNAIRMVGILRDISIRKEEELRLKMLEMVLENMGDPVVITEADPIDMPGPRIIYANPAFTRITGYTLEEAVGNTPRVLQGKLSNRVELKKLKEALQACTPFKLSTINYKKNREPIWINAVINPVFNEKGKCVNWVGVQRDVTLEKKTEIALRELNSDLLKQTKMLEHSNRDLEQFAFIASHDLQEPLRMIISFLGLLEKRYENQLDEKGRQYIQFAVNGSHRLRQIILDILSYSRIGRLEHPDELINLDELLLEVKDALKRRIVEQNASIKINQLPTILTKRGPLLQVLQNLIENALKYVQKDISPIINITVIEKEDAWQFSVEDNGIGIGKEFYEKIFVIFQRLHNRADYEGTGLGLAITKKAIEKMGGRIWVESELGKGSTFFFTVSKSKEETV